MFVDFWWSFLSFSSPVGLPRFLVSASAGVCECLGLFPGFLLSLLPWVFLGFVCLLCCLLISGGTSLHGTFFSLWSSWLSTFYLYWCLWISGAFPLVTSSPLGLPGFSWVFDIAGCCLFRIPSWGSFRDWICLVFSFIGVLVLGFCLCLGWAFRTLQPYGLCSRRAADFAVLSCEMSSVWAAGLLYEVLDLNRLSCFFSISFFGSYATRVLD